MLAPPLAPARIDGGTYPALPPAASPPSEKARYTMSDKSEMVSLEESLQGQEEGNEEDEEEEEEGYQICVGRYTMRRMGRCDGGATRAGKGAWRQRWGWEGFEIKHFQGLAAFAVHSGAAQPQRVHRRQVLLPGPARHCSPRHRMPTD